MRLLLDTHAILWWLLGDLRLPERPRSAIEANTANVLVSAVSAMEIATKFRIGKLPEAAPIAGRLDAITKQQKFVSLPISSVHADLAGGLPIRHRDPFDRLLIAQAQIEQAWLVSNEQLFDQFGVRRLW
ncbi:type II toxin-antitoxin system VapC family toxin [Sphingomonas sp. SUN019]|uniref:type II toxin-antitoxin system VapC family toxin n=1 Tax=Sphingomonas sp. SUN019 TaxID=2937788 RepID=UPI00216466EA|nr:type II toxin-antitoxin system VapC family toxin [Sphingomonas sp. SUN019]UVO50793.1 type II toxin-antitoxin system VapC family toxin [Sphingomonas sp. SUN019]